MKPVNKELQKYIEKNIFPLYSKNEEAHNLKHINYVINRCFELINDNSLNVDIT